MSQLNLEIEGLVATLTIDSPPANALSISLLKALDSRLDEISKEENVKAIIIKGEGRFFSAGADIKEFTSLQSASDYEALAKNGQDVFNKIEGYPIPIIAAIHGAALGGGLELALACHVRLATSNAKIGLPETTLGILPGFAGTQRLPAYVGPAKATEMILSGKPISGQDAYQFGLVNHVIDEDELFSFAEKLANSFANKSKPVINEVMKLISFSQSSRFTDGIEEEAKSFARVFGNEDAKEGIEAFLEKRAPNFKDK